MAVKAKRFRPAAAPSLALLTVSHSAVWVVEGVYSSRRRQSPMAYYLRPAVWCAVNQRGPSVLLQSRRPLGLSTIAQNSD